MQTDQTISKMSNQGTVDRSATEAGMVLEKSTTDQLQKTEESPSASVKTGEQQATGSQNQGDAKAKKVKGNLKGKRRGKPGKIHIRLPPIEAYQKDLCFAAEAPGRVVVRLERLMGSDKIRPVDGKFMDTLIQRLEEEEKVAWEKKIKLRKKAEKERHRQLAISGLMEPGPGMEDLYNHPVFRVNRILNRLSSLDSTFSHNPVLQLPPIVQINPFENDESGAFFKEYPYHRALRKECEKFKDKDIEEITEDEKENEAPEIKVYYDSKTKESQSVVASEPQSKVSVSASSNITKPDASKASSSSITRPVDMEEEDEYDEELLEENLSRVDYQETEASEPAVVSELTEIEQISRALDNEYMESLTTLQKKYGVPDTPDFENDWKPFRCELVNEFITNFEISDDIYDAARTLFELYTRQAIITHEYEKKATKKDTTKTLKMNSSGKKQFQISEPNISSATVHSTTSNEMTPSEATLEENEDVEMFSGDLSTDETENSALEYDTDEREVVEDSEEEEPFLTGTDEKEAVEEE